MPDRRRFLQAGTALGAGVMFGAHWKSAWAYAPSPNLAKFIQPLRDVGGPNGIPVAASDGVSGSAVHYSIALEQFQDQLHPQLPNATRLWGYRPSNVATGAARHLGGVIVAQRGTPVRITATNSLPAQHILPVDATIMGAPAAGQPANNATIHLHGGFVPWISDGGPHSWFNPAGQYGQSVVDATGTILYKALNPSLAPGQAEYFYPNGQGARLMWYHDHAIGTTRLNAYAGLASAYVVTDDYENLTMSVGYGVPGPLDPRTKYLIFQDKTFVGPNTSVVDPTWSTVAPGSRPGDLWYEHVAMNARAKKWVPLPPPDPSAMPEFFGDTILVNGTVSPYLEVEPRQYRLRLLNACNSRFLNPRLVFAKGLTPPASTEPQLNAAGPAFLQIGNECGFLPAPVMLNGPKQPMLLLAPAERADLIVDFRNVPVGSLLILYSDAAAPFPTGSALNDYHPANPKTPNSIPGSSPNTRTLLQIRVVALTGGADAPVSLPATAMQNPLDGPFLVQQVPGVPTAVPPGVPVRRLTLNEGFDAYGRLLQTLGTDVPVQPPTLAGVFARAYDDPATEVVNRGATEVWEILNLTADTHPIHFHLVNVQILSRQAFKTNYAGGPPALRSAPIAPDANEMGWKETVRMNPGEVTRVIMKFDLPGGLPFVVPPSARTGGNEYVWHCHILEHEEHDMMRPLVVN
ncbi:multicopper oxidase family protein [Ramlibacter sp. AN1133]|uniref:multicopper oxidase family protein n=1 Tax=Ramlibacter sp. AN1133 TaxID=3133429 RepID=UPI0030BC42F1